VNWRRAAAACAGLAWGLGCGAPSKPRTEAKPASKAEEAKAWTNDDVREAFAEATGRVLDDPPCIARPPAFDAVIAVGRNVPEQGCAPQGLFVLGHWVVGDIAVQRGLTTRGWLDASAAMRRQLAWDWTREVAYAFGGRPLESAPVAFGGEGAPKFHPPSTETNEDGSTSVTVWVEEPAVGGGKGSFSRQRLRYDSDGSLTTKRLDRFVVP
jgi:hypothetical protein